MFKFLGPFKKCVPSDGGGVLQKRAKKYKGRGKFQEHK